MEPLSLCCCLPLSRLKYLVLGVGPGYGDIGLGGLELPGEDEVRGPAEFGILGLVRLGTLRRYLLNGRVGGYFLYLDAVGTLGRHLGL